MGSAGALLTCWTALAALGMQDAPPLPSARTPGQTLALTGGSGEPPLPSARVRGQTLALPAQSGGNAPLPSARAPGERIGQRPTVGAAGAQEPAIVLTEKDFGQTIAVKPESIVEVRLPIAGALFWAPDLADDRAIVPVGPAREQLPADRGPFQTLGGTMVWTRQFKVNAKPGTKTPLAVLYSDLGEVSRTREKLQNKQIPEPPADAFRTQMASKVFQEGTAFKVTLDVKN